MSLEVCNYLPYLDRAAFRNPLYLQSFGWLTVVGMAFQASGGLLAVWSEAAMVGSVRFAVWSLKQRWLAGLAPECAGDQRPLLACPHRQQELTVCPLTCVSLVIE